MKNIIVRKCKKSDKKGVVNVCYHTGYMGEDAEPHFSDKKLFGLLFCSYYPQDEPENCFVAVDKKGIKEKIVGYILSSLDTKNQEKRYNRRVFWKVILRLLFITSWRYFNTFKFIVTYFLKHKFSDHTSYDVSSFYREYPAHLHIDILEGYQYQGVGTRLMKKLEDHLKKHNIKGVFLGTSEKNYKAIPFYEKHGFKILKTWKGIEFWPGQKVKSLIFGKKL